MYVCHQTAECKVQMKVKNKFSDNCHRHGHMLMTTAKSIVIALLWTGRRNIGNECTNCGTTLLEKAMAVRLVKDILMFYET